MRLNKIRPENTFYKLGAIFLALLSPILYIYLIGYKESISAYWDSNLQPLFIFTNAVTSYYLFSTKKWQIPSSLLLLLTVFSVADYKIIHNCLAISFFLTSFVSILMDKRYKWYSIPYLSSLFYFNGMEDMLVAEIIAVYTLCAFHGTEIFHMIWLDFQRKNRIKLF